MFAQRDGPQIVARFLQSVPVQLPAPASQHRLGDSSTISYAHASVLQRGRSVDKSVDTVDTEPHLEALTQHVARYLTGASTVAEANILMDSSSGITAMSKEPVEALRRQPEMMPSSLTQAFARHACVMTSLGQECYVVTQSCPLHIKIEPPLGTSPLYSAVHRAHWGRRCKCNRAGGRPRRGNWDQRHGPAQGIGTEDTRA